MLDGALSKERYGRVVHEQPRPGDRIELLEAERAIRDEVLPVTVRDREEAERASDLRARRSDAVGSAVAPAPTAQEEGPSLTI